MPDNDIDKLIAFLSDSDQDKTGIHKFISNVLQELNGLIGSDDFSSEADRAVDALQKHDQSDYAEIISNYAQNPSDEALASANSKVMDLAMGDAREMLSEAAARVDAPTIESPESPSDEDISERMAHVEEQLKAITPEFIEEKLDEALRSPEAQAEMERRGINPDDVIAKKPELIGKLHEGMQELLKQIPELAEKGAEMAHEQIEQAIENFPEMFDDALKSELAEAMADADQRMQKKFDDAASEIAEARAFQENGELSKDPNSNLAQRYSQAVVDMADNLMKMRETDPKGFESMKEALGAQTGFGEQVAELLDQRLAEENAMGDGAPIPGMKQ